jgi:hypothetical protein
LSIGLFAGKEALEGFWRDGRDLHPFDIGFGRNISGETLIQPWFWLWDRYSMQLALALVVIVVGGVWGLLKWLRHVSLKANQTEGESQSGKTSSAGSGSGRDSGSHGSRKMFLIGVCIVLLAMFAAFYFGSRSEAASERQSGPNTEAASLLAPQLRFVAWGKAWQVQGLRAMRHPDGTEVTNATERALLEAVGPAVTNDIAEFMRTNPPAQSSILMWFCGPYIQELGWFNPTVFRGTNDIRDARCRVNIPRSEKIGGGEWRFAACSLIAPPAGDETGPTNLSVHLRYSTDLSAKMMSVNLRSQKVSTYDGWSVLGVGQDAFGHAFVALGTARPDLVPAVLVHTRNGIHTCPSNWSSVEEGEMRSFRYTLATPLTNIADLRVGMRPARVRDWPLGLAPEP